MSTWPSPRSERLGTPKYPAIRFTRGTHFGASLVRTFATACQVARPPVRIRPDQVRPPGAFTSRLSTGRSPFPLLDMTTTATGLLCWRDSHPLEWQLASLHQIRTCGFPAYGSHLGCVTASERGLAVCVPAPVTRLPGSESGACFAGPHSPWSPPFAPPTPQRIAPLCSSASQLLWRGQTSRARASSATAPHLPDAGRQRQRRSGQTRDLPASDAILLHVMWPSTPAGRQHLA